MPLQGALNLTSAAERAVDMPDLAAEPMEVKGAEIFQVMYEIDSSEALDLLPKAFHPTIPSTVTFVLYKCADSPIGGFTLGQVRIGCRAGVRPRGFLVGSFIDDAGAGEALRRRWGFNCREAEVSLRREYHRITGRIVLEDRPVLEVSLIDPEPISGSDVQYVANMNLARVPVDGETKLRLIQVDPEFVFHKSDRGRPSIESFDAAACGNDRIEPVYPVSAVWTVCDVTIPRIRYICDPDLPALQGTQKIG